MMHLHHSRVVLVSRQVVTASADPDQAARETGASGEVRFAAEYAGKCYVSVYPPGGGRINVDKVLVPGEDWLIEVVVGGGRNVVARVVPQTGGELPPELWFSATFRDERGVLTTSYLAVDDDLTTTFRGVSGNRIVLELMDVDGRKFGLKWADIGDGDVVEVHVPFRDDVHHLKFVDAGGSPLGGRYVVVTALGDPLGFEYPQTTDDEGIAALHGFETDRVLAFIRLDRDSMAVSEPIDLVGTDPILVQVSPAGSAYVRLLEGGEPAAGVKVALWHRGLGVNIALKGMTSATGEVRFDGLSEGPFRLQVQSPGWWPTIVDLDATADPPLTDLPVHRRGSLRIRATRGGLLLLGASVSLTSVEDESDVAIWIDTNLVHTGPSGTTTGSDGRVSLEGLRAGRYQWSASAPGLPPLQGQVDVAGLAWSELEIAWP